MLLLSFATISYQFYTYFFTNIEESDLSDNEFYQYDINGPIISKDEEINSTALHASKSKQARLDQDAQIDNKGNS